MKQQLDPHVRPSGDGWYHRIDDIPSFHLDVDVVTTDGRLVQAKTKPATAGNLRSFEGIGAEVVYDVGGEILLANQIAWIRTGN